MKKILLLLVITSILISCKDKEKDRLYEELIAKSNNENQLLSNLIHRVSWSLNEKLYKPETIDLALIWNPKAQKVKHKADTLFNYLDSIINLINQDSATVIEKVNLNEPFLSVLYNKLLNYKIFCLSIDSEFKSYYEPSFIITSIEKTNKEMSLKTFIETNLNNKKRALCFLSILENNILSLEFAFLDFCDKKSTFINEGYYSFNAIAVQNTEHLKAGEKLKIIAGEGYFSKKRNNRVFINNKQIKLNSEGVAEFNMIAPNVPGKYHVPVKIEFSRPDSTKGFLEKDIEYTVDE